MANSSLNKELAVQGVVAFILSAHSSSGKHHCLSSDTGCLSSDAGYEAAVRAAG